MQTDLERCYNIPVLTASLGTEITFSNTDTVAHAVTADTASEARADIFDSGFVMLGDSYTFTLEEEGAYDHFCLVRLVDLSSY